MEEKKNCPETAEKAETTETKEELVPEDESKLSEEELEDVSGGGRSHGIDFKYPIEPGA